MVLIKERLADINYSISTLTGMIEDKNKCIKELELDGDLEELRVRCKRL